MFIIISITAIIVIAILLAKKLFIKNLQDKYESSLLKGDKQKSLKFGRLYYLTLDETDRKAKGIEDIEAKISNDFHSFNSNRFPE